MEWQPPAAGSVCWTEIPATDVPRAKAFYSTVFNWSFKALPAMAEDQYISFVASDKKTMGGIVKTEAASHLKGPGAVKLYIYVEDLEKAIDDIVKNGGKKCSEIEPEGDTGLMIHFDDCEGNRFGIYTMKK
jgi:predicted enzyme related to lactoylglutathione lyase